MPRKRNARVQAERLGAVPAPAALRSMPAAEALSFLRETRGVSTWTIRDMVESLRISAGDAEHVIAILELQGYVEPAGAGDWMTTPSGEGVSRSKPPRYTGKRVDRALAELRSRIAEINRDSHVPYEITEAVTFGDFLSDRPHVQSVEAGIQLVRRGRNPDVESAKEQKARRAFLRRLQGKGGIVRVRPYERWMSERTHADLLSE